MSSIMSVRTGVAWVTQRERVRVGRSFDMENIAHVCSVSRLLGFPNWGDLKQCSLGVKQYPADAVMAFRVP